MLQSPFIPHGNADDKGLAKKIKIKETLTLSVTEVLESLLVTESVLTVGNGTW